MSNKISNEDLTKLCVYLNKVCIGLTWSVMTLGLACMFLALMVILGHEHLRTWQYILMTSLTIGLPVFATKWYIS